MWVSLNDKLSTDDLGSNETPRGHDMLAAVSFAASTFWQATNWRETLSIVLERLGVASRVNRAYIFENSFRESDNAILTSQVAEWVAPGTEPQIDNESLQEFALVDLGLKRWNELLLQKLPVYGLISDFPESEREILQSKDILSLAVVPVFSQGQLWGFVGFDDCESLREWTPTELDTLSAAATTLGAAIDRQQLQEELPFAQKMEAIGNLASGVAHDFNNMLQVISAYTSIAQSKLQPGSPALEDLDEVMMATARAHELTQQLLGFARKQEVDIQEFFLVDLCDAVKKLLTTKPHNTVCTACDFADPSPVVAADFGMISQALLNICLNGCDAMPDGGELKIGCSQLTVQPSSGENRSGEFAVVSIRDSGPGIRKEDREKIFEPFFTTKGAGGGTGLGLSLALVAIQQSGGFVEVLSAEGEGTEFLVYLPIAGAGQDSRHGLRKPA